MISRRVLTWCLCYKHELLNYPNVCLSAYVNKLWLKAMHIWMFGLMVYILLKKCMCKHVGKNSLIFIIAKCCQEQLTWGHGADDFRLIFVNSLYMLYGALLSSRHLRCESISSNVLRKVRFWCNFNFDAWFQERTIKKRKVLGIHHCIILILFAFISKFCFTFSVVRDKLIIKFNIDLFCFHFDA